MARSNKRQTIFIFVLLLALAGGAAFLMMADIPAPVTSKTITVHHAELSQ